jgi:hypothetical protein
MPAIKQVTRETRTPLVNQRLVMIDEILYRYGHISSRKYFHQLLNRKLEKEVSMETLDKDIRTLRMKLKDENTGVEILFVNGGYRYSVSGYRYYKYQLDESECRSLAIIFAFFRAFSGYGNNEAMHALLVKIISNNAFGRFEASIPGAIGTDLGFRGNEGVCVFRLMESILCRETLKIDLRKDTDGKGTVHLIPRLIHAGENGWYLAGSLIEPDVIHRYRLTTHVIDIRDIESVCASNRPYQDDPGFDPHLFSRPVTAREPELKKLTEPDRFYSSYSFNLRA